jgi:hypothetical protein
MGEVNGSGVGEGFLPIFISSAILPIWCMGSCYFVLFEKTKNAKLKQH